MINALFHSVHCWKNKTNPSRFLMCEAAGVPLETMACTEAVCLGKNNLSAASPWSLFPSLFSCLQLILFITSDLSTLRLIEFLSSVLCTHSYMTMWGRAPGTDAAVGSPTTEDYGCFKKNIYICVHAKPFIPFRYVSTAKNKIFVTPTVCHDARIGQLIPGLAPEM